ncbi:MAG: hypothetical protein CVT67_09000 [Actinobacteria bacterium HGW-Actinobacteria-7]|nr:MAG: hypothetical protein CVT67_09000 [Actinobacteria bacterium HGW-Actinobacteria-7]
MTSTSPSSNPQEDRDPIVVVGPDLLAPFEEAPSIYDDPYAENELVTRHERTERAIRKAQEQV